MIIPSVFVENDRKKHMSINLSNGLWQCFKTGKTGNFIRLYSILEQITYRQAESTLMLLMIQEGGDSVWTKKKIQSSAPTTSSNLNIDGFIPINLDSYQSNNKMVVLDLVELLEPN